MAITDPRVVKFSDEQLRPISEKMRNLYYELKSMQTDWYNGISALCPAEADNMLEDGREDDGASRLSGNDVVGVMIQANEYIQQMEVAGVLGVIQKPCIQSMRSK